MSPAYAGTYLSRTRCSAVLTHDSRVYLPDGSYSRSAGCTECLRRTQAVTCHERWMYRMSPAYAGTYLSRTQCSAVLTTTPESTSLTGRIQGALGVQNVSGVRRQLLVTFTVFCSFNSRLPSLPP
ncbi:hypothetical protein J6590_039363 [Homalodisca vitripennis]|nr:hypothetical protein J6590_039363 [Homalodisca vitripennis]